MTKYSKGTQNSFPRDKNLRFIFHGWLQRHCHTQLADKQDANNKSIKNKNYQKSKVKEDKNNDTLRVEKKKAKPR